MMNQKQFLQLSARMDKRVMDALRRWARESLRTQQSIITQALVEHPDMAQYIDQPRAFTDYLPKRGRKYREMEDDE